MLKVEVYITFKKTVLDPEGLTVKNALHSLGYKEVVNVSMGKFIILQLDIADKKLAEKKAEEFCKKLLVNPIIEDYKIKIKRF